MGDSFSPDSSSPDIRRWYFREGLRLNGPHTKDQLLTLFTERKLAGDVKIFLTGKEHEARRLSQVYSLPKSSFQETGTPQSQTNQQVPSSFQEELVSDRAVAHKDENQDSETSQKSEAGSQDRSKNTSATAPRQHTKFTLSTFHPWRRSFARTVDLMVISTLLSPFLKLLIPESEINSRNHSQATFSFWYLAITSASLMTNATLISKFGVTPGKWLLGIRVLDENRSLLKFPRAFIRELGILLLGLTAGLVVVSPLVIAFTYLFLKLKGVTPWDRIAMATSEFENISVRRLMVMFPAFLTLSIFWKFLTGIVLTDIR